MGTNRNPGVYKMTVMILGTVCSPLVEQFIKKDDGKNLTIQNFLEYEVFRQNKITSKMLSKITKKREIRNDQLDSQFTYRFFGWKD